MEELIALLDAYWAAETWTQYHAIYCRMPRWLQIAIHADPH